MELTQGSQKIICIPVGKVYHHFVYHPPFECKNLSNGSKKSVLKSMKNFTLWEENWELGTSEGKVPTQNADASYGISRLEGMLKFMERKTGYTPSEMKEFHLSGTNNVVLFAETFVKMKDISQWLSPPRNVPTWISNYSPWSSKSQRSKIPKHITEIDNIVDYVRNNKE